MGDLREAPVLRFWNANFAVHGNNWGHPGLVCRAFKASLIPPKITGNGAGLMEIGSDNGWIDLRRLKGSALCYGLGFSFLTLWFVGTTGDIWGLVCRAFNASFIPPKITGNGAGLTEIGSDNG